MLHNHDSPQRKTSIKAKLRSISINRHKPAATDQDEHPIRRGSADRSTSLQVPEQNAHMEQPNRSRARSPAHTALMDHSHSRPYTADSTSSTATVVVQPQLAAPIVASSGATSLDAPSNDVKTSGLSDTAGSTAILETVKAQDDATESSSAAGGFLSSVLSAATSFGTVLGANSPRSVTIRSPKQDDEAFQDSPARASTVQSFGTSTSKQEDLTAPGELSLKDMGIVEQVPQDQNARSRSRASSRTTTVPNHAANESDDKHESRANRSGSIATTQSRRRRGSTAMSVFSGADGQGQKITGFAVASNKRNREFHATFRSVPDADYLLDDYGCALQKEILVHGRMYVSESHICFNSNIFGWVTNLVISFMDITALEKKSTAGIFPNAIQISTQQAKHVFASFISRDTTFDLIVNIWRLTHPSVQTTAHGVEVAGTDGDELYDSDSNGSSGSEEDALSAQTDVESVDEDMPAAAPTSTSPKETTAVIEKASEEVKQEASTDSLEFPGPREHAPTEAPALSDGTAYPKALIDECFNAPVGKIYELLYGNETKFMQDFLTSNQKLLDVQVGQFTDKAGKSARASSYIKPLSGSIGPKQTRCLLEDVIELKDFSKCIQVVQTTTSPDVPSGDAFAIKTRFALMWGPRNTTRFVANCTIEWSKTSWIKGPIEKASNAGQVQFMSDLSEALKAHLNAGHAGKKRKGRAKHAHPESDAHNAATSVQTTARAAPAEGLVGNILGIVQNINIHALTLLLLFGMLFAMIRMQRNIRDLTIAQTQRAGPSLANQHWQRGETDLWNWLAERTLFTDQADVQRRGHDNKMTKLQLREALAQAKIQAAVLEEAERLAKEQL